MFTPTPTPPPLTTRILSTAARDEIDLTCLPFLTEALSSITALSTESTTTTTTTPPRFNTAHKIDTHTHPVPAWFRALEPSAAGRPTPVWSATEHLNFMAAHDIAHSVLSISTPQANAFAAPETYTSDPTLRLRQTVALARLLNEFVAELCAQWPARLSWLAVLPLPYVGESVAEARYALEELGACGVVVLSQAEGVYPGDEVFGPLWGVLESRAQKRGGREVVMIHPTEPVISDGRGGFVGSRPSPLRAGLGEFYFETARALSSLLASTPPYTSTLLRYPHIHWRISHGAGAFPDISERFFLGFPETAEACRQALRERCWFDGAGPVWPGQIRGVLGGLGVGVGRCVFGTDYPYGIGFWDVDANIRGLEEADFITDEERRGVESRNALDLWGSKLPSHLFE